MAGTLVAAVTSRRWVSLAAGAPGVKATVSSAPPVGSPATGRASVGASPSWLLDDVVPAEPVAPSLRNSGDASGVCTTWRTAAWPRSMDCDTRAVAVVATAAPMATPTTVPFTPKVDAMTAAITAPTDEARIWRSENFTPPPARHRPPARPAAQPASPRR